MPHPPTVVSLSLPMASRTASRAVKWTEATDCLDCGGRLEFHQPDAQRPDRLLGVCEDCCCWAIVEVQGDRGEVVVIMLPERLPNG